MRGLKEAVYTQADEKVPVEKYNLDALIRNRIKWKKERNFSIFLSGVPAECEKTL